jgi:hypothetical protein
LPIYLYFLSRNKTLGFVYQIEPIHAAHNMPLFGHYIFIAVWHLLQSTFRGPSTPSQVPLPWDITKKYHSTTIPVITVGCNN